MMIIAQPKFEIKSELARPLLVESRLAAYGARTLRNARWCAENF